MQISYEMVSNAHVRQLTVALLVLVVLEINISTTKHTLQAGSANTLSNLRSFVDTRLKEL